VVLNACISHLTRHVWAGDQLLCELRLDSENRSNLETPYTTGPYHGRVSYFHAGGIDRPLVIRKEGVATVIPHQNWRGQFARGTYPSGQVSDCGPGQTTGCTAIDWPGYRTTAWHARSGDGPDIRTWFGGLVDDMRDASGQMYRRNRYYDPATGQFTQADPIGLAGGLNAYGFAAGDPVSYSDPYGLKVCFQGNAAQVRALRSAAEDATGAAVWLDKNNCVSNVGNAMDSSLKGLRDRLNLLAGVENIVYNVSFGTRGSGDDVRALSGSGAVSQSRITRHCPALVCPVNIRIGSGWATGYRSTEFLGVCMPWNSAPNTLAHTFTHEVLGHGFEYYAFGAAAAQARPEVATIRRADNVYLAATNQPLRCGH
jgi:RHS repeat-associated protein